MQRFVIDTDTGCDDAIAILMALAAPNVEVKALTTVAGNVPLAQATRNALSTLRVSRRPDVPVYVGCDRPLLRTLETALDVHGADGLGNSNQPDPGIATQDEHGVNALVRLAAESNGEDTLITLGPLTNVAVALAIDPDLLTRFERVVIMGGAPDVVGNVSDMAEFNIWVDPEAAARVFAAPGQRMMVGWNVSMSSAQVTPPERKKMAALGTDAGQFAHDITAAVERLCLQELQLPCFMLPDPLAVAIAIDPAIATRTETMGVRVACGDEARGATFPAYLSPDVATTDIVWDANQQAFSEQMFTALAAL